MLCRLTASMGQTSNARRLVIPTVYLQAGTQSGRYPPDYPEASGIWPRDQKEASFNQRANSTELSGSFRAFQDSSFLRESRLLGALSGNLARPKDGLVGRGRRPSRRFPGLHPPSFGSASCLSPPLPAARRGLRFFQTPRQRAFRFHLSASAADGDRWKPL